MNTSQDWIARHFIPTVNSYLLNFAHFEIQILREWSILYSRITNGLSAAEARTYRACPADSIFLRVPARDCIISSHLKQYAA